MVRSRQPIEFTPGIVMSDTDYAQEGRYVDGDHVRFVGEKPEKLGGYEDQLNDQLLLGICRGGLHPYITNASVSQVLIATTRRVHLIGGVGITNVTPYRATGSLSNAFDTTNGSAVVTVHHTDHDVETGTFVVFENGTAIGGSGITLSGSYEATFVDNNTYTVTHGSNASATVSSGGSADYSYEINPGLENTGTGRGYGVGPYGQETYGTPRSAYSMTLPLRTWSTGQVGEDVYLSPRGGTIYKYDTSAGGRAAALTNAPDGVNFMFISHKGHVFALGQSGAQMLAAWSDDEDTTKWTPAADNDAGFEPLSAGSKLLAGTHLSGPVQLIWSDKALYRATYTGDQGRVFEILPVTDEAGIVAPHAFCEFGGRGYWLSRSGFWSFDGAASLMPRQIDIRDHVLQDFNWDQADKAFADTIPGFQELIWFYPSLASNEVDKYVLFNALGGFWCPGTLERTSWRGNAGAYPYPLATDADGHLYGQELGKDADGSAFPYSLTMAPFDLGDGDYNMDVLTLIPDTKRQVGDMTVTVITKDEPRATGSTAAYTLGATDEVLDMRENGRQVQFVLSGNSVGCDFRLGKPRLEFQQAGRRLA